ncbi:unnamed protein product [Cylicocyclus nassatus]|uniref:Peptidase A2 domain-containing protein n=1 Tax=Cylicocyclus nassatus TaxID=53992 RepID=A0AA36GM73_CYLNA|nr:unnamed protein product [Cylicocyclus nassatus]
MAAHLITDKRLLTHYCSKLDTIISRFKGEELETLNVAAAQGESASQYTRESLQRLSEAIGALDAVTHNIKQTMTDYATKFTELDYPTEKDKQDFEEYSAKAEKALISATDYSLVLKARVHAFTVVKAEPEHNQHSGSVQVPTPSQPPHERLDLPTLPVPIFQGNIWEWDNFWELFNENVHSRNIPELCKFNYLLQPLRGDALALIKKFQVAKGNYSKAIEFLQHKYGDRDELVTHLIEKLGKCHLHSASIRDQRTLFEQLQVIIMQLRQKEVQVDNQWMYQQVLTKFPDTVQRKVLVRKQAAKNSGVSFNLDLLIQYLEEEISTDEMLAVYMKNTKPDPTPTKPEKRRCDRTKTYLGTCMYCEGSHKSADCKRYSTPQERSNYLRENKLCLICASAQHSTANCKKRMCFRCGGPHHTSCCFRGDTTADQGASRKTSPPLSEGKKPKARDTERNPTHKEARKINALHEDNSETEAVSALDLQPVHKTRRLSRTFLPAGILTVMNPTTKALKKVGVLLDSGAEVSFIESSLANELELPTIETTRLPIHTFGTEEVKENLCRRVLLQGWDSEGHTLDLKLFTHDVLTAPLDRAPYRKEDLDYMKEQNILMTDWQNNTTIQPRILLGCDQLWPLIKENQPSVCLPSGLYLLSTRLGNLITGIITKPQEKLLQKDETAKWEAACTMDGKISILTVQTPIIQAGEDEDSFEKYLVMEFAGTEEFMSSEKVAQEKIDQQVWNQFKETIEKREDGYYVRLPWKSIPFELPDNKAIALRRLESVWNTLRKDEKLLEQYNEVFEEQLKANILEEILEDSVALGEHIHYVPHQAVITPQKTTTKLRIVFDASAHYKASPSLNDVLHRGPVILPQLYGLLLRFRIGKIAIISDVEKAFLQDGRILPKQRRLGCAILIAATHMAANKAHCSLDPPFRQECRRPGKCQQPVTHITIYATFRTE